MTSDRIVNIKMKNREILLSIIPNHGATRLQDTDIFILHGCVFLTTINGMPLQRWKLTLAPTTERKKKRKGWLEHWRRGCPSQDRKENGSLHHDRSQSVYLAQVMALSACSWVNRFRRGPWMALKPSIWGIEATVVLGHFCVRTLCANRLLA
jgi:hypothetical protein